MNNELNDILSIPFFLKQGFVYEGDAINPTIIITILIIRNSKYLWCFHEQICKCRLTLLSLHG